MSPLRVLDSGGSERGFLIIRLNPVSVLYLSSSIPHSCSDCINRCLFSTSVAPMVVCEASRWPTAASGSTSESGTAIVLPPTGTISSKCGDAAIAGRSASVVLLSWFPTGSRVMGKMEFHSFSRREDCSIKKATHKKKPCKQLVPYAKIILRVVSETLTSFKQLQMLKFKN